MLGARPYIGRLLLPEDARPGAAPVAILSYGLAATVIPAWRAARINPLAALREE